jgi:(p)ppGpp synthase/HD superfamily hydrolase
MRPAVNPWSRLIAHAPGYDWKNPPGGLTGLAATFATVAHCGQVRKVTGLPYIVHPFRVAALCGAAGCTDEQIAAAWCHDVLEDCPTWRDEFFLIDLTPGTCDIVRQLTKTIDPATGKGVKGEAFLAELRAMETPAKAVKLADRIDNLRDGGVMDRNWMRTYVEEAQHILTICGPANATLADILDFTIRDIKDSHALL